MANPSSLEARIAAAHAESLQNAKDLDREYEKLSGNRIASGIDLGKELEQYEEDFRGMECQAQLLEKALQDARAASEGLREKRQELGKVLEANTGDTLQQLAKQVQRLFDEVPELGLVLGSDADQLAEYGRQRIVDKYKAVIPGIESALVGFRSMVEDLRKFQSDLQGYSENTASKITEMQEAARKEVEELGKRVSKAEESRARWESVANELSKQLSDARLIEKKTADENAELVKQTGRQNLMLKYYHALVFGDMPKQDIDPIVVLIEGLRKLDLLPEANLLTLYGLGPGTMNSFEIAATALFKGCPNIGLDNIYDFDVTDAPFLLGSLLGAFKRPLHEHLGMSESLTVLRMTEILALYLRSSRYWEPVQKILERLQPALCESKLVTALYGWVVSRDDPLEYLKGQESIRVGEISLLIDQGWLLMFGTSIAISRPGHYTIQTQIQPGKSVVSLDVNDYQGEPWNHEWSIREIIDMKGAFERIFPQPRGRRTDTS